MNEDSINPYSPPNTTSPAPPRSKPKSMVAAFLVSIATATYVFFMAINLSSTSIDRQAGQLLIINTPVMLLWSAITWRTLRYSIFLGTSAIGVQVLIMAIMLGKKIGDPEIVVLINGLMILCMGILTGICNWYRTTSNQPSP